VDQYTLPKIEQRVLGCIIMYGEPVWRSVCDSLDDVVFGSQSGRAVYRVLVAMDVDGTLRGGEIGSLVWTKAQTLGCRSTIGKLTDEVSVLDGALDHGAYLVELADNPGTRLAIREDIASLRDAAKRRVVAERITSAYHQLDQIGYDPLSDAAMIAEDPFQGSGWTSLYDVDDPGEDERVASWGIPDACCRQRLNDSLPLIGGRMYVLAAKPGGGKTTAAVQVMAENAKAGKHVAFISMEMSKPDCWRFFNKHGLDDDARGRINILDCGGLTPERLASSVRAACRSGADLVVVDHISYVREAGHQKQHEAISMAARLLVEAIKKESACLLVLAQMTRDGRAEGRDGADTVERPPALTDLRGSADIEQGAACVVFFWVPPDAQLPDRPDLRVVRMKIAKNRFGPLMNCDLRFYLTRGIMSRDNLDHSPAKQAQVKSRVYTSPSDDEDLFGR